MSRTIEITQELVGLCGEVQRIQARAVELVEELSTLGTSLPPEMKAMLLSMKPTTKQC